MVVVGACRHFRLARLRQEVHDRQLTLRCRALAVLKLVLSDLLVAIIMVMDMATFAHLLVVPTRRLVLLISQ